MTAMNALYENAMRLAVKQGEVAKAEGELPFGVAVVTLDGEPVVSGFDRIETSGDPTRHGEFDMVRAAIAKRGADLSDCILVSTVEPCAMCSGAAWYAGIRTSVFGVGLHEMKAIRPDAFEEAVGPVDEVYGNLQRRLQAVAGILRAECLALWDDHPRR